MPSCSESVVRNEKPIPGKWEMGEQALAGQLKVIQGMRGGGQRPAQENKEQIWGHGRC